MKSSSAVVVPEARGSYPFSIRPVSSAASCCSTRRLPSSIKNDAVESLDPGIFESSINHPLAPAGSRHLAAPTSVIRLPHCKLHMT